MAGLVQAKGRLRCKNCLCAIQSRVFSVVATLARDSMLHGLVNTRSIFRDNLMKTFSAKKNEVRSDWYVVNADGKVLGRLATEIAHRLRGKHKPEYTPSMDVGDHIVVINAEKIRVTGNKKPQQKTYYRHTGYVGNLKSITLEQQLEKHPERVIEHAVKGMLPKNPLGRQMYSKLRVYAGGEHPHTAQQPQTLEI